MTPVEQKTESDIFAKGMSHWEAQDSDTLSNYTRMQHERILGLLGQRVLEVGSGTGRLTAALHASRRFDRYVALEPSPTFHEQTQARCPGVETYQMTIDQLLAKAPAAFDTVIASHVLEHIEDDLTFLRQLRNTLQPGGRIILMVPALNWLMSDLDRNIGHYRRYNKRQLKQLAHQAGYRVELLRYDNLIGIAGWLWFCKIRKIHYQEKTSKKRFLWAVNIFDKWILPAVIAIEKRIPPPLGLHLMAVLQAP